MDGSASQSIIAEALHREAKLKEVMVHLDGIELLPFPGYGDLFTIEEFTEMCKDGTIANYDGSGCYAISTRMTRIPAIPYDFANNCVPYDQFTHVIWFNK